MGTRAMGPQATYQIQAYRQKQWLLAAAAAEVGGAAALGVEAASLIIHVRDQ